MKSTLHLLGLAVLIASSQLPAHAVQLDRVYNKEAITVNFFGSVAPTFAKETTEFTYLYNNRDLRALDRVSRSQGTLSAGTLERLLTYEQSKRTDEQLRMAGMDNAFVGLYASQRITQNLLASAMLGVSAYAQGSQLITGDLMVRHDDIGQLTIGANSRLPTSSVATSGTYNTLDRSGSFVGASYTAIPKLSLGGYYVFAESPAPTASGDSAIQKGYGATVSYKHTLAPRNELTLRAGYSHSQRDDELVSNTVAQDKNALMAGVRYNYYNTTISLDGGMSQSDFKGNLIDKNIVKNVGISVDYELSPRLTVSAAYGKQNTTAHENLGQVMNFDALYNNTAKLGTRPIESTQLFKYIDKDMYKLSAVYDIHRNVALNANISRNATTYRLTDGDFAKQHSNAYSAGLVFSW